MDRLAGVQSVSHLGGGKGGMGVTHNNEKSSSNSCRWRPVCVAQGRGNVTDPWHSRVNNVLQDAPASCRSSRFSWNGGNHDVVALGTTASLRRKKPTRTFRLSFLSTSLCRNTFQNLRGEGKREFWLKALPPPQYTGVCSTQQKNMGN